MKVKNLIIALFIILIAMPQALANLSISSFKTQYNLGDTLTAEVNISVQNDTDGILTVSLHCPEYDIDFYATPITMKKGDAQSISIKPIPISPLMKGSCNIDSQIQSFAQKRLFYIKSNKFTVTDKLDLNAILNKKEFIPGEELQVKGTLNPTYGLFKGEIDFSLDDIKKNVTTDKNSFSFEQIISKTAKSGTHSIILAAKDGYDNIGTETLEITIKPMAASVSIKLNAIKFEPLQNLELQILVYDQANDTMNANVSVEIIPPSGKPLTFAMQSNEKKKIQIGQFDLPGKYKIQSTSAGVKAEAEYEVQSVQKINLSLAGKNILCRNTGNIQYNLPLIISVSGTGTYQLTKRLSLKPNETATFNFFAEVPAGTYSINLASGNSSAVYSNITTTDERSGFRKLTGAVISEQGSSKIISGFTIIAVIATLLVAFFTAKYLRKDKPLEEQIESKGNEKYLAKDKQDYVIDPSVEQVVKDGEKKKP